MREFRKSRKFALDVAFRPHFVKPNTSMSMIDQTKKKTSQRAKMFPMMGREATAVLKSWLRELSLEKKGSSEVSSLWTGEAESDSLLDELERNGAEKETLKLDEC